VISGESGSGPGPRWKPALVGVALVVLAVSIALFSGPRRTGNATVSLACSRIGRPPAPWHRRR
jgi:hypothetical protein